MPTQVADIDFFSAQPFPPFDVITMGMILHDWGPQKKRMLMQKVKGPGGLRVAVL